MKFIPVIISVFFSCMIQAQPVAEQLKTAMSSMEKDDQFAHASIGLYVVNSKTGAVVFDKNSQVGLAPASTLKVVTSAAAFELLGKYFTYNTFIGYDGMIIKNNMDGELIISGSGDPTFGSWRWKATSADSIFFKLAAAFKQKGIQSVSGTVKLNINSWESQATPDGWTWEDMGNYYGAGAGILNWHENSYNLELKPGKNIGDPVRILGMKPAITLLRFNNELKTAKEGSGDNAVIYLPEDGMIGYVRGTIPAGTDKFVIRGAMPAPEMSFFNAMKKELEKSPIKITSRMNMFSVSQPGKPAILKNLVTLASFTSPPLDSINYWFMKESINLYGEAFLKTIAFQKKGFGSIAGGLEIIRDLWKTKGISQGELKMKDGSGLSPANRITPHALVEILRYASTQDWFSSFHHSLPLQNNIKMKSGYIGGVRSYAGYIKSKTGEEYTFSFIINNFDGSPGAVREKMWKLLDIMK